MRKIKLIFNTARKKLKPVWTAIIQWLTKVVKTIFRILLGLLITAATLGFFVVPFLNTLINKSLAQWIWYPSAALFFLTLSIYCRKKKEPTDEPPIFDLLGKWGALASTNDLDFNKSEDIDKIQDNTFYVVKIDCFTIRNVSDSNILLKGIYFNNLYHPFAFNTLVDKGGFCQIQVGINHWFASPQKITSITLLVTDILLNEYAIECQFHAKLDQLPQKEFAPNEMEYTVYPYVYNIESLSLPNYQHQT